MLVIVVSAILMKSRLMQVALLLHCKKRCFFTKSFCLVQYLNPTVLTINKQLISGLLS